VPEVLDSVLRGCGIMLGSVNSIYCWGSELDSDL
jgi:uncharacterized protein involved in tolerance to divalent cations